MPRGKYINYDGSGYSVVIIDSGWDRSHDNRSMVYDYDFVFNDGNAFSGQRKSHGGAVATVVREYAPDVNLIHLRVLGPRGGSESDLEQALQWCVGNAAQYNIVAINAVYTLL